MKYAQPTKDIIAYIPNANLHEQELLDGATSIGKLYSPRKQDLMFILNTKIIQRRVTNEKMKMESLLDCSK